MEFNLPVDTIKTRIKVHFWDHFTASFQPDNPTNFTISVSVAPVHPTISQSATTFYNSSTFYWTVIDY